MKTVNVKRFKKGCIVLLLNFAFIPLLRGDDIGPRYVLSILAASDGRTWVGTEGEGLFWRVDGGKWHRDDAFSPVGGTNVFALCEDSRGRVWAGTLDRGACVWDGVKWTRLSIKEGLQGSHVYALSSDPKDGVWISTDAGLCRYSESRGVVSVFTRASGLPSIEISSLCVARNGDVYAGSSCFGVYRARRRDDWRKWDGPVSSGMKINAIVEVGKNEIAVASNEGVEISSDSVRGWRYMLSRGAGDPKPLALCAAPKGLFIGFEEHGVKSFPDGNAAEARQCKDIPANARVTCAASDGEALFVGTYGKGVLTLGQPLKPKSVSRSTRRFSLPKGDTLMVCNANSVEGQSGCYYLKDDWATKGDWCGRYGLRLAVLCAQHAPYGDEIVGVDPRYRVRPRIGENKKRGDVLRRWVHWKSTDRVDSLYNPLIGHRRQSEWDDHSETYPQSFTGPNLVVDVTVPKGWQEVAFYFFNKDGETGNNFRRDYFVTARRNTGISEKPLAATRVTRFRNGVYKRFAVQGPGTFVFEVERDNSFSTILSGVFVRKILERPEVQSSPRLSTCAHFGGLVYREPSLGESDMFQRDVDGCRIGSDYDIVLGKYISRYRASHASEDSAEARLMRWNLRIWNDDDRYRFDQSMLAAWTCLQMKSPKYRNAKFFPDSPNVLHRDPLPGDYSVESPLHWIEDAGVVNPRPVRKSDGDFYLRVVNLHGTGEYLND